MRAWPWSKQRYQPDGNEELDTLRRLYDFFERGWYDSDEALDEIEQIVRAWWYGRYVANPDMTSQERRIIADLRKKRRRDNG